jgi:hydrogenase-1 operon protein HyaF
MSELNGIGITIEHPGRGDNGLAVISEIAGMLKTLVETGEGGSIDMGTLPLGPADLDLIEETLGEGEVSAEVDSLGLTHVRESGVPGVWWVTHLSEEGDVMARFIEVAECPEILLAPHEAIQEGLDALRARLFELERESRR